MNHGWDAEARLQQRIHIEECKDPNLWVGPLASKLLDLMDALHDNWSTKSRQMPAQRCQHSQWRSLTQSMSRDKLPDAVKTRAHNRRSQPSVRTFLTEFYFTLLPQPGEQAKHLGNLVKNPTSACSNPVAVITNIEMWRVSIQLYKELTGQMPIQEDIKTAFEKLISPILKNVTGFDWKKHFVNRLLICQLQQQMIRFTRISHQSWRWYIDFPNNWNV